MRLLDRYLLREFLVPLGYCLGGFLLFWISFHLFSELDEFQKARLQVLDLVEYYIVTTPDLLTIVLPISLLLATLYALTNHARHQELTAMRAAGISLWRIALPYVGVGFLFSLSLLWVREIWLPDSSGRGAEIMNRYVTNSSVFIRSVNFKNARDGRSWNIPRYDLRTDEMTKPQLSWDFPNGSRRDVYAERGFFTNNAWTFVHVKETFTSPQTLFPVITQTNELRVPELSETPDLIRSELKINAMNQVQAAKRPQLSVREILTYFDLHPRLSRTRRDLLETQLHGRLAEPWTCLVVVLIALPFGAASGRRNVFVGVASSVAICFVFFILQRLGLTLGTGGWVPPWLGAWFPNLAFGAAGLGMTCWIR